MMNACEITLDLETLDLPGSKKRMPLILSIGAAVFDPNQTNDFSEWLPNTEEYMSKLHSGLPFANYSMYYSPVSLSQSLRQGFTFSSDTLKWWDRQKYNMLSQSAAYTDAIEDTFLDFARWLKHANPKKVWARSPTFDTALLRDAFDHVGLKLDIDFRVERDVRTAEDFSDTKTITQPEYFLKHHALCDAIWEAVHVQHMYMKKRFYAALEKENEGLKLRIQELNQRIAQFEVKPGTNCEN